jgi:hypothetical protein
VIRKVARSLQIQTILEIVHTVLWLLLTARLVRIGGAAALPSRVFVHR